MTKTALVEEGLRALLAREAEARLAALGGKAPRTPGEALGVEQMILVDTTLGSTTSGSGILDWYCF